MVNSSLIVLRLTVFKMLVPLALGFTMLHVVEGACGGVIPLVLCSPRALCDCPAVGDQTG